MGKLLVLGGTGDAIKFVQTLTQQCPQLDITTSLAGRTSKPKNLIGNVRIGGFGGVNGLVNYLLQNSIDYLIDITHPCAGQISHNAFLACQVTKVPHLIFCRPQWHRQEGDQWIEVANLEQVPQAIPHSAKRIFITTGRQNLTPFVGLTNLWFLIRSVDLPEQTIANSKVILDRGPFSLAKEVELLNEYQIDTIVTKNSGGDATYAKILAARELQLPVIMVQRPPLPAAEIVTTLEEAIQTVLSYFGIREGDLQNHLVSLK